MKTIGYIAMLLLCPLLFVIFLLHDVLVKDNHW